MALSEISSSMKFRFKDLISEGKISRESIDKALGPEFKNHNLARIAKSGIMTTVPNESGYTISWSGNTNAGNLISKISHSGLEEQDSISVSGFEGPSIINEEQNSSGGIIIVNNTSSVTYISNASEKPSPEPADSLPPIQVAPGTPIISDVITTKIAGHVMFSEGTVSSTAEGVAVNNDIQGLSLNEALTSHSGVLFPAVRDNGEHMRKMISDCLEIGKPFLNAAGEGLATWVQGWLPLQTSSGHQYPHTHFWTTFDLPNGSGRESGYFYPLLR